MAASAADILRNMKPMPESNGLIGDPDRALGQIEAEGYAFFRDVLDAGAVRRLKQKFLDVLIDWGFVDEGSEEPVWNGKDLAGFPAKIEPLHTSRVWEDFVGEPTIDAFFTKLLGAPPFWLEITEYRVTPPSATFPDDPFIGRHQDAFYNMGMDCYTCWIPLMEIDEVAGGLAMSPGLHRQGYFHDQEDPPQYRIPDGVLPADNWHRNLYRPGDLVMFHKMVPHSGLPNMSDRFRMSMDIRVAPITGQLPVIGEVLAFTDAAITVRDKSGQTIVLEIDDETYCRWTSGKRIPVEELRTLMPVGSRVLASAKDGNAISLRPPR